VPLIERHTFKSQESGISGCLIVAIQAPEDTSRDNVATQNALYSVVRLSP